jgi:hypothetical protein
MILSKPQRYILTSKAEINLFLAGVGSGKTHLDGIASSNFVQHAPLMRGFIGANTYNQLNTSTMLRIREVWQSVCGWKEGIHYVVNKKPLPNFSTEGHNFDSYNGIVSFWNGCVIFTGSLDNAKAHDGKEFGWAILDETKDTKEEDVKETILTRLRQPGLFIDSNKISTTGGVAWNPMYITTSPAKVDWINNWFDLESYRAEIKTRIYQDGDFFHRTYGNKAVAISSTYHNQKNLPANFISKILQENNTDRANALIFADPFSRSGGEFYTSFDAQKHVGKVEFVQGLPVHISFDQNVQPYITATLWQVVPTGGGYRLQQFDEFCLKNPENTTEKLCRAIKKRWGGVMVQMFMYGDRSGHNGGTRSSETDYIIIKRELRPYLSNASDRTNTVNPNVEARRDFINNMFEGVYNYELLISKDCPRSIADLTYLKQDPNGNKLKERAKDEITGVSFEKYGHTSDSMDYFITKICTTEFERFRKTY